jgi:hypothetical protein
MRIADCPKVLIPSGAGHSRFLGNGQPMTGLIESISADGRILVPLPPIRNRQWFNVPENQERLKRALAFLDELRRELLG